MAMSGSDYFDPSLAPGGIAYAGKGVVFTQAYITALAAAGFSGVYKDPRYINNAVGPITLPSEFSIQGNEYYGLGYAAFATPATPPTYINFTNVTGDGFVVTGTGIQTSGNSINIIGVNILINSTGIGVHLAGGERNFTASSVFVWNSNATAGSYAFGTDTTIGPNGEDNLVFNCSFFGNYGAFEMGVGDLSGASNDCLYVDLQTGGVTYGINAVDGGNNTFINWYDRSNCTTCLNMATAVGAIDLIGGETRNTTGQSYNISFGALRLYGRQCSSSTTANSCSGGIVIFITGIDTTTWNMPSGGTGTLNICDTYNATNMTVTGVNGTVYWYSTLYGPGTTSAYTGALYFFSGFPTVSSSLTTNAATTTRSLTIAAAQMTRSAKYRVSFYFNVRSGATDVVTPTITFTDQSGTVNTGVPISFKALAGLAFITASAGTGYFFGEFIVSLSTSPAPLSLILTGDGAADFASFICMEQLTQ